MNAPRRPVLPNLDECAAGSNSNPGDITQLLAAYRRGEEGAESALWDLVYPQLHAAARRQMFRERAGHTLQPTSLVNETFVRLAGGSKSCWNDRAHFLAVASKVMRHILVEQARRKNADKRGSGQQHLLLDESLALSAEPSIDVQVLHDLLARLEEVDPGASQIVDMRIFAGMTENEVALALGKARRTVQRDWQAAVLWLRWQIASGGADGS